MQYTQKSFTLPASGKRTSQEQWDYATLTAAEFVAKYGKREMDAEEKEAQRQGFAHGNVAISNPRVTREMIRAAAVDLAHPLTADRFSRRDAAVEAQGAD